jgi:hypothetical protein
MPLLSLRRSLFTASALLLLGSAGVWAALAYRGAGTEMTAAAEAFLASLTDEQRATATVSYDDPRRLDWHFIPKPERKGLQIKFMDDAQRAAAHKLLESALSEAGYDKAVQIMALEGILRELEKTRVDGPTRDTERYYFTVFGAPAPATTWGLSVEGHHLSLNFVVVGDQLVATTPTFFGANPAEVKTEVEGSPKAGTRVLRDEEDLAFKLVNALSAEQRSKCLVADKAPADLRAAGEAHPPAESLGGIPFGELSADQQETLRALIRVYADNLPAEVAEQRLAAIASAGEEKIAFAWAGALQPGIGHYYVIQGPTFAIELVNTQPDAEGNVANHIHSQWRDMAGDFGLKRE